MTHRRKTVLLAFALICTGLILSSCGGEPSLERQVFALVNAEREHHGLDPLHWHQGVTQVARAHSRDMVTRGFFAHECPDGSTAPSRLQAAGLDYNFSGENLGRRQSTARQLVDEWMNSPEHRAILLHPHFTHTGIGFYIDADGQYYWTQKFIGNRE